MAEIFLGNLQLRHLRGLPDVVEDGGVGLTGLEVEGTVLRLQDDVAAELAVFALKLAHGLLHTVLTLVVGTIDERAPHDDAPVGRHRVGQHVGTVGMAALVVAGAGLSFAVGLHQEAAEVGYLLVDLAGLPLPPRLHLGVLRVGSLQFAEGHGRGEVHREKHPDAIGAQDGSNLLHLVNICR